MDINVNFNIDGIEYMDDDTIRIPLTLSDTIETPLSPSDLKISAYHNNRFIGLKDAFVYVKEKSFELHVIPKPETQGVLKIDVDGEVIKIETETTDTTDDDGNVITTTTWIPHYADLKNKVLDATDNILKDRTLNIPFNTITPYIVSQTSVSNLEEGLIRIFLEFSREISGLGHHSMIVNQAYSTLEIFSAKGAGIDSYVPYDDSDIPAKYYRLDFGFGFYTIPVESIPIRFKSDSLRGTLNTKNIGYIFKNQSKGAQGETGIQLNPSSPRERRQSTDNSVVLGDAQASKGKVRTEKGITFVETSELETVINFSLETANSIISATVDGLWIGWSGSYSRTDKTISITFPEGTLKKISKGEWVITVSYKVGNSVLFWTKTLKWQVESKLPEIIEVTPVFYVDKPNLVDIDIINSPTASKAEGLLVGLVGKKTNQGLSITGVPTRAIELRDKVFWTLTTSNSKGTVAKKYPLNIVDYEIVDLSDSISGFPVGVFMKLSKVGGPINLAVLTREPDPFQALGRPDDTYINHFLLVGHLPTTRTFRQAIRDKVVLTPPGLFQPHILGADVYNDYNSLNNIKGAMAYVDSIWYAKFKYENNVPMMESPPNRQYYGTFYNYGGKYYTANDLNDTGRAFDMYSGMAMDSRLLYTIRNDFTKRGLKVSNFNKANIVSISRTNLRITHTGADFSLPNCVLARKSSNRFCLFQTALSNRGYSDSGHFSNKQGTSIHVVDVNGTFYPEHEVDISTALSQIDDPIVTDIAYFYRYFYLSIIDNNDEIKILKMHDPFHA